MLRQMTHYGSGGKRFWGTILLVSALATSGVTAAGCSSFLGADRRQAGWLTHPKKRVTTTDASDADGLLLGQQGDVRQSAMHDMNRQYGYTQHPDGSPVVQPPGDFSDFVDTLVFPVEQSPATAEIPTTTSENPYSLAGAQAPPPTAGTTDTLPQMSVTSDVVPPVVFPVAPSATTAPASPFETDAAAFASENSTPLLATPQTPQLPLPTPYQGTPEDAARSTLTTSAGTVDPLGLGEGPGLSTVPPGVGPIASTNPMRSSPQTLPPSQPADPFGLTGTPATPDDLGAYPLSPQQPIAPGSEVPGTLPLPASPNPAYPQPTSGQPASGQPVLASSPMTSDLWNSLPSEPSEPAPGVSGHFSESQPSSMLPFPVTPDALARGSRNSVSIEEIAEKEEMAMEKARLIEIARKNQQASLAPHLRPLEPWNGPFAVREETDQPNETDIILASNWYEHEPIIKKHEEIELYDWEKEQEKFDWEKLDPVNFFNTVRDWVGMGPDEKKARALMEQARDLLRQNEDLKDRKKTQEAAKLFLKAAKRLPKSVVAEDCYYLAGECYFFSDQYTRALECYKRVLEEFPHSQHIDTSVRRLFAIGRYWEKQSLVQKGPVNFSDATRPTFDTFGNAKKAYEAIFLNDMNGPISDDAVMALAMAFLARGQKPGDTAFEDAAYHFNFLCENFPNSRHVVKAREMLIHALANCDMGAEYDKRALDRAERVADQTLRQHGHELGESEKQGILEVKGSILEKRAEAVFEHGRYYDNQRNYGAARISYERVIREYPQTIYAGKAQARLEAIADKPDVPGHFDWVNDLKESTLQFRKKKEGDENPVDR